MRLTYTVRRSVNRSPPRDRPRARVGQARATFAGALSDLAQGELAMMVVPLIDLQASHAEISEDVARGFERVLREAIFIGGEEVCAFEREYAAFCGLPHCVGVANGT